MISKCLIFIPLLVLVMAFSSGPNITKERLVPVQECGVTYAGVQFGVVDEKITDLINRLEVVDCDAKELEIKSFEFITEIKGERVLLSNDAATIGSKIRNTIEYLQAGDRFIFYDVMAIDPNGIIYELGPISIQLVKM